MTAVERIARVRISLQEIQPVIWRLIEMPQAASLKGLHDVIQASFGWLDYHLYQFEIGGRRYGIPDPDLLYDPDVRWARNVKLGALIDKGHMRFGYVYDFGDDWRCDIAIEAIEDGVPGVDYPRLIAGERRGPPEDVGGAPGYLDFIHAMADPTHEEHARMKEWYGGTFDPADADWARIGFRVGKLAARRRAGKEAYEKSRRAGASDPK